MSGSEAIYIDSSLLVAVIAPESARHRQAVEWAGQSPALVTSVLAEVEVLRALRRREAPRPVISVARRLLGEDRAGPGHGRDPGGGVGGEAGKRSQP